MVWELQGLLALDFDGVLCNGLREYFQSSWRAYCQLWAPPSPEPPVPLQSQFCHLRPVIETGWEMPLLLRSLMLGRPEAELSQHWPELAPKLLATEGYDQQTLAATLDRCRDDWIGADLADWLAHHAFFPGVVACLKQWLASPLPTVIITTKEKRFVQQLLQKQGIHPGQIEIWGKEVKQPKHQTLRQLLPRQRGKEPIWFVEDRLKTLQSIQPYRDLTQVQLYLADWGYNTAAERGIARRDPHIQILSRQQFVQGPQHWP